MGHNRDYTPISPTLLFIRLRASLERLRRFANGNNRYYAPVSPIELS